MGMPKSAVSLNSYQPGAAMIGQRANSLKKNKARYLKSHTGLHNHP